jgi:hypothetical protein
VIELACGIALIAGTLVGSRFSGTFDLYRFALCWIGVLVALDGAARVRTGTSPLGRFSDWLACAAASVLFWDIFELVDLRLQNWWYRGVSPDPWAGAAFGALCFATVLPAVRLGLAALRAPEQLPARPVRPAPLALAGAAALGLALAFPRFAFPLAWLFLWPLCEAALALLPRREGLRSPLEAPRMIPFLLILALPLGLLWEFFNWRCARGWFYTVPFFDRPKLFEMPLPGYLGYLPFLLEAGAALALLDRLRPYLRGGRGALALCAVLVVHLAADRATRAQTVISFSNSR